MIENNSMEKPITLSTETLPDIFKNLIEATRRNAEERDFPIDLSQFYGRTVFLEANEANDVKGE